jgi:ABC-type multidrug transport system ATPase subunit
LTRIILDNVGKKFNREWIFRGLSCEISPGEKMVILGGNGSGKSTLLQAISSFVSVNEGSVNYFDPEKKIEPESFKDHLSFASPYLQLVEEFTATELIEHLLNFKKFRAGMSSSEILKMAELSHAGNKFVKQYSSGMKQRLKLALAILADSNILMLDEPLSNLDKNGAAWYKNMIDNHAGDRTVIVCSNAITGEYDFCTRELRVTDYKP